MRFEVIPAIDVRGGAVVRLAQGDYQRQTTYADDPLSLAMGHADAGARRLHLVDLDGARDGTCRLLPLLAALAGDGRLQVQVGGGVRSEADVEALLQAGAARVVIGSLAVREPARVAAWLQAHGPESLVIALDARRDADGLWRLPTHGWTRDEGALLEPLLGHYAAHGARHLLCTDIDRDGMLAGPNLDLYRRLCADWPQLQFIASGGVRDARDVHAAREAGCSGIVLGRALLEGRLGVAEALEAAC